MVNEMSMDYNIMLVGFMGVGKTTISAELSKVLHLQEIDMDSYITEYEGLSISEMFSEYGEEYFRNVESDCLIEIQKRKGRVVSCGGGIVMRDENIRYMKDGGVIVLLTATPQSIYERVKDSTDRPILNGNMNIEFIKQLMEKRNDRYQAVADITVATDGREVRDIVEEIVGKLKA